MQFFLFEITSITWKSLRKSSGKSILSSMIFSIEAAELLLFKLLIRNRKDNFTNKNLSINIKFQANWMGTINTSSLLFSWHIAIWIRNTANTTTKFILLDQIMAIKLVRFLKKYSKINLIWKIKETEALEERRIWKVSCNYEDIILR